MMNPSNEEHTMNRSHVGIRAAFYLLALLFVSTPVMAVCTDSTSCNDHGTCASSGICFCNSGWTGALCDTATTATNCGECADMCNSGSTGICTAAGSDGVCYCKNGYGGLCCTLNLSGAAVVQDLLLTASAATLDFGSQPVTSSSALRSVYFRNMSPDIVVISSVDVTGDNPSDFSVGGVCTAGANVAKGGSCTVTVAFAPSSPASRSATLTITAKTLLGASGSSSVSLSGSGTVAANSIAGDPNSAATLYAGLEGGGVYKSLDKGVTWTAATTQPANTRIKAVAISKSDSTKLYAATYGGGVYKSVNSGVDWAACASQPTNLNLLSLMIDASGKLYAGSEAGVFVSGDGCGTWTAINSGLP